MKIHRKKASIIAAGLGLFVAGSSSIEAALTQYSVNLWSPGRNNQAGDTEYKRADWLRTLRLEDGQSSGVWTTSTWDNINVAPMALNATATINGSDASTATFRIINKRNQSAYRWTVLRDGTTDPTINPAYMGDGTATLLDGKLIGTEVSSGTTVNPDFNAVIEVSGLGIPVYDVIVYFTMNFDQFGSGANAGVGYVDFNNTGLIEWKLPVGNDSNRLLPTTFTEVVNSGDTGNYVRFNNVTGDTFTVRAYGKGFNHGGISGFQILQVPEPTSALLLGLGGLLLARRRRN